MPIFRINNKFIFFAHIPKCGGTTAMSIFTNLGGSTAFHDGKFREQEEQVWNKSSPQHIDGRSFEKLFPESMFDYKLSIVRHPIDRFVSAFYFNRTRYSEIGEHTAIDDFVRTLDSVTIQRQGLMDNHFRPAHLFMPKNWDFKVFKLENGFEPIIQWIKANVSPKSGKILITHKKSFTKKFPGVLVTPPNTKSTQILKELYYEDFKFLGYETDL